MAKGPAKVTIACPHCHATQQEYEQARSTFCRNCGKHIDLQKQATMAAQVPPGAEEEAHGVFDRFSRLFTREKIRHVRCLHCSAEQTVSSLAKSGSCVQCGHYLDFRDFKIDGNFSKTVETHGVITITKSGEVTSSKLSCSSAVVHGKIHGNLVCSTTAHVRSKGRVLGSIQAKELIIEKQADVEFVRSIHVGSAEINGKISASIFADAVVISKTGSLDGAVTAKSIQIEKGGIFHGDLIIGQQKEEQQELLSVPEPEKPARKKRDLGQILLRPAT